MFQAMPPIRPSRIPVGSEVERHRPAAHGFQKGRAKSGGRAPGEPNRISKYSQTVILEALETFGRDGKGKDGVIGFLHRAFHEDVKHGVNLLIAITPKLLEANIIKAELHFQTIAELDQDLAKAGLPPSKEIFALDFKGTEPIEQPHNEQLSEERDQKPGDP
jgi:hypothetical protein